MKTRELSKYIIGGLIIAIAIATGLFILFKLFFPPNLEISQPTPVLKIITASTPTTTIRSSVTMTALPSGIEKINEFGIGAYVEVSGTGTEGLRFRSSPSKSGATLFIAMESEAFKIENGPEIADGYTWWYLSAPYDQNRSGWVVADYLTIISTPNP